MMMTTYEVVGLEEAVDDALPGLPGSSDEEHEWLSDVSQVLSPLLVKVTPIRINDLVQALTLSGLIGDHPVCSTILSAP